MEHLSKHLINWASILEPTTREQALATASMPFVYPHVALMPDAHLGKGATVGSVIPTLKAIIPAAVGVDIGCGMIAVRTQFTRDDFVMHSMPLATLRVAIERAIPLSAGAYNQKLTATVQPRLELLAKKAAKSGFDPGRYTGKWESQLGSLGSGNHFIEVTVDEKDRVWLFLHSGSRGVGNKIAQYHINVARELCERWWITLPDRDLAYLPEGIDEFWHYIRELRWAQEFALLNREEMMDRVIACVAEWLGTEVTEHERINCFAGDTEVITRTGVLPIEALAGGWHELLTADGVWVKAPVCRFGRQVVSEVVVSRCGVVKTIRATTGHRWLLRSRRGKGYEATTAQLEAGDRLQVSFPCRPKGLTVDKLAAARGFVYGDGHRPRGRSRSCANFVGQKDAVMLPFFEGIGHPPRRYGNLTRIHGLPGEWKTERPRLDAAPSEIYGWLAGYFAADGDVDQTGRPTLASACRVNLEYVRLACQAVGIGTFGIRSRTRIGLGKEPTALYLVGLMRGDLDPDFFLMPVHRERFVAGSGAAERRGWNVVAVRSTEEMTDVYCAVVEGTHSFALADNILTGNCHHNFTQLETHFGEEVWLSRKGAIEAKDGQPGLIPGSMGTASYVVTGKGNAVSLNSSPHGAGRNYSRSAARRQFNHDQLREAMQGIEYRDTDAFIDEIPQAYKPIDQVMADAADLVEVRHVLRQLVNVKGD